MFTVTKFTGLVANFDTLDEAVRYIGYGVHKLRGKFSAWLYCDEYEVRDEFNLVVPVAVLKTKYDNLPYRPWPTHFRGRFYAIYDEANFRRAPVPGIRSHRGRYRGDRRPRTKQERTVNDFLAYDDDVTEHDIEPRGSRTRSALPTNWDDIPSARRGNNWKYQRKTRWKVAK